MTAIICSRCECTDRLTKAVIEVRELRCNPHVNVSGKIYVDYTVINIDREDLCPQCYKDFEVWIKRAKEMKKFKFAWEEIGIKVLKKLPKRHHVSTRVRKILDRNAENYFKWIIDTACKLYKKKLKECEKFNACAFYMNDKNNRILLNSLSPMVWLYSSPVTLDELKDDEYAVKIEDLVERT